MTAGFHFLSGVLPEIVTLAHDDDDRRSCKKMASNQDIFDLIKQIKADQDEMRTETVRSNKKIEKELSGMNSKLEHVKEDAKVMKNKVEGIEDRLLALEKDNERKKREEYAKRKREDEKNKEEKVKETEEKKKEKENQEKSSYAAALRIQPDGSEEKTEALNFKSTWAKQLSQANLEQQLRMATEAAKEMEGKEGDFFKTKLKTPAKQNKLGNSLDRHSEQDWAWDEGEDDWDGTTERQAKNREKKQKEEKKRKERIEKAAYIGRCTIGIGPIRQESTDYFNKITADYGLAKKMAAAEFLQGYLKFDECDLSDIDITDTKMSANGDNIMYCVLDCPEKVINIRRRIADCQNDAIKTREFIPPQFFARYTALAKYASELRADKPEVKTQIRFLDRYWPLYKGQRIHASLPTSQHDRAGD